MIFNTCNFFFTFPFDSILSSCMERFINLRYKCHSFHTYLTLLFELLIHSILFSSYTLKNFCIEDLRTYKIQEISTQL